jgi:co-chaperonin GroES (HSP10)
MKLRPILNHIVFKFKEDVDSKGYFNKSTDWGFELRGHADDSAKAPRWVTVIEVGPDCKDVKPGDDILVKPLMWSLRFKFEDEQMWRTDDTKIVAADTITTDVDGKQVHNFRAFGKSVIFLRMDVQKTTSESGLAVLGKIADFTAFGKVVEVGPEVDEELKGATVYFLDQNFFGYFEYRKAKFCYLQEDEILAYEPKE